MRESRKLPGQGRSKSEREVLSRKARVGWGWGSQFLGLYTRVCPCLKHLWWPAWGAGWRMGCTRQVCLFLSLLLSQSRMASGDQENKGGLRSTTHAQGAHVRKMPPRGPAGSAFTLERSRGASGGVASEQWLGMAAVFKGREGRVYWSAQAAMRKYHRRGSLTDRHLPLSVLELEVGDQGGFC